MRSERRGEKEKIRQRESGMLDQGCFSQAFTLSLMLFRGSAGTDDDDDDDDDDEGVGAAGRGLETVEEDKGTFGIDEKVEAVEEGLEDAEDEAVDPFGAGGRDEVGAF